MNIKKVLFLITIITLSLSVSACGPSLLYKQLIRNDEKASETRLQNIIAALENKDTEGLKKMFSPNALKEAKNIGDDIKEAMDFYKGKVQTTDGTYSASDLKNDGRMTSELNCSYMLKTDAGDYTIYFVDKKIDSKDPDNEGLYILEIIKEPLEQECLYWDNDDTRHAGIYCLTETEKR